MPNSKIKTLLKSTRYKNSFFRNFINMEKERKTSAVQYRSSAIYR